MPFSHRNNSLKRKEAPASFMEDQGLACFPVLPFHPFLISPVRLCRKLFFNRLSACILFHVHNWARYYPTSICHLSCNFSLELKIASFFLFNFSPWALGWSLVPVAWVCSDLCKAWAQLPAAPIAGRRLDLSSYALHFYLLSLFQKYVNISYLCMSSIFFYP